MISNLRDTKSREMKICLQALGAFLGTSEMREMKVADNVLELIGSTPMVRLNKTTKDVKTTVLAKLQFLAWIYVDRKRQNFAKEFYDVPRFGALFWGLKRVAEKRKEFLRLCLEKMPLQAFPK